MIRIKYQGPAPERRVLGQVFPAGRVVDVTDRMVARQALALPGFTEAKKRGRPRKVQDGENQPERD